MFLLPLLLYFVLFFLLFFAFVLQPLHVFAFFLLLDFFWLLFWFTFFTFFEEKHIPLFYLAGSGYHKAKDTKVHDDHRREEVLALLQAWKDNVPASDINRREIRMPSTASLKHSKRHLDARSGCPRLPNSETLVPVWRTDSADAKAVLHTGTNASAFGTSWPPKNQEIHEFGMNVWCFQGSWPHKNHAPRGGNSLSGVGNCPILGILDITL